MTASSQKPRVLLDWFTVSYRSVAAVVVLVLALLAAAGWYVFVYAPSKPRQEAQEAISRAEDRLLEAARYPSAEQLDEIRGSARAALTEGRDAFQRRQYDDAKIAAIRSENFSQKAIDLGRGEGSAMREVRISHMEGDVRVKRAGEFDWETADRKMLLHVGDQLKTAGSGSVQLVYFDGTVTTINPGSLLEIREIREDPTTKVRRVSEKLNWGEVLASTQKRNVDGSFHEVATEKVTARSDDVGEFRVSSDKESKASAVDVFNGRLQIASGGRVERLTRESIRADAGAGFRPKKSCRGCPASSAPADQKDLRPRGPHESFDHARLGADAGAARYHLMISDRLLFTSPRVYDADRPETSVQLDGIQPGEYYWKVAAVSSAGIRGSYSEPWRFRVTSHSLHDKEDTTPPALEITENVQSGPMLILNGRTEPGALLWVDNEKVDVTDDGTFYAVIRLRKEGVNDVSLLAQDASGNVKKLTHRAYVDPY
jgi:hypothetical protein